MYKEAYKKNKKQHLCGGKREKGFETAGYENADFGDSDDDMYGQDRKVVDEEEQQEQDLKLVSFHVQHRLSQMLLTYRKSKTQPFRQS